MSLSRPADERVHWSLHQWALRAAVLAAPVLGVLCAAAAGAPAVLWALLFVVPGAVGAAVRPDSHWVAAPMALTGAYWLLGASDELTGWSLVAAALLLAGHSAASMAALGPPGMRLDRTTLRTWARRLVALLACTVAVWAAARAMTGSTAGGSLLLTVLAVAVLGLLAAALGG